MGTSAVATPAPGSDRRRGIIERMKVSTTKGRLLVANPALPDANFHRTVVLMLEHTGEGALGVVLNRPSELAVAEPLPRWEALAADPPVLFVGGPVDPSAAICLAEVAGQQAHTRWQPVLEGLGTLDLEADDESTAPVHRLRVFAGYAGWGPSQLESEIDAGAWFVVAAQTDDVMSSDPRGLWREVLRRQGGFLASLAAFPEDPSVN